MIESNVSLNILTEEQRKLIEENLPFCYYWFKLHNIYNEDTQQALLLNVCNFIHLYNPAHGKITTFIGTILQSRFYSLYKEEHADKRIANTEATYLDTPLYIGKDDSIVTLSDTYPIMEKGFDQIEAQMIIANICKNLKEDAAITPENIELFYAWMYSRNYTFCSKLFNMPKNKVEITIKKIYKIIREHHLENKDIDPKYKKYTLSEIKDQFFALNKANAEPKRAVVVLAKHVMSNRTKSNRSFIISSDHPFFANKSLEEYESNAELSGHKINNQTGKIYLLCKYIKDENKDIELCYLLD